jgi:uncharacterized protein
MADAPLDKLSRLRAIFRQMPSVLVAYSGGVDSALLMTVAHEELGDKALACIGRSPSYPAREMQEAIDLARERGARCRIIDTREYLSPHYAANDANRCYFCKSELFDQLRRIAQEEGWAAIVDGNNASDLSDDRPGATAARERGVRSPLIEAGITKTDVRLLAHHLGLKVWDKPAMACLSSRVPHGTAITPQMLAQIEQAEEALASLGFRQYRVRHHGEVARLELPAADLATALERRQAILDALRGAGFRHVALDLAGFRDQPDLAEAGHLVNLTVAGQP